MCINSWTMTSSIFSCLGFTALSNSTAFLSVGSILKSPVLFHSESSTISNLISHCGVILNFLHQYSNLSFISIFRTSFLFYLVLFTSIKTCRVPAPPVLSVSPSGGQLPFLLQLPSIHCGVLSNHPADFLLSQSYPHIFLWKSYP